MSSFSQQAFAFVQSLRSPVKQAITSVFNRQVGWFVYLNIVVVAIIVLGIAGFSLYYAGQGLWSLIALAIVLFA